MPSLSKLSRSNLTTNYLNPLDIPEILKLVISNVKDLPTLKSVREVNKLWRWESMDQLKRTAVLFLSEETVEGLINAYLNKHEEEELGDFKSFFYQISERPFQSYRVPYGKPQPIRPFAYVPRIRTSARVEVNVPGPKDPFTSLPDPSSPLLKSVESLIWDVYFSRATLLDLGIVYFGSHTGFGGFKWILKKCPGLKVLDIDPYIETEESEDDDNHSEEPRSNLQPTMRGRPALEAANGKEVLAFNLETLSVGRSLNEPRYALYHSLLSQELRAVSAFKKMLKCCPKLKNVWTHSVATNGNQDVAPIVEAAEETLHELESLTLVYKPWRVKVDLFRLDNYLTTVSPPLKSLVLTIDWRHCAEPWMLMRVLESISQTLTKLELFIYSNARDPRGVTQFVDKKKQIFSLHGSDLDRLNFPNLTHFKVALCYSEYEGKGKNHLLSFDFRTLVKMKNLKEFRYESGLNVEKSWVCEQVTAKDLHLALEEGAEEPVFPALKLFHYHKRLTFSALQKLGRWMPGLETLEVVLDKQTFPKVLKIWPGLKQITLLPCSDVPKGCKKDGVVVIDESQNYTPAEGKSPEWMLNDGDYERRVIPCFRNKAHHVINY